MTKFIFFLFILINFSHNLLAVEKKPYHHLSDGTFRNPEGSPVRSSSFNWSFKVFNEEKKKLDIAVPEDHVINKIEVLKNQLFRVFCSNLKDTAHNGYLLHRRQC